MQSSTLIPFYLLAWISFGGVVKDGTIGTSSSIIMLPCYHRQPQLLIVPKRKVFTLSLSIDKSAISLFFECFPISNAAQFLETNSVKYSFAFFFNEYQQVSLFSWKDIKDLLTLSSCCKSVCFVQPLHWSWFMDSLVPELTILLV